MNLLKPVIALLLAVSFRTATAEEIAPISGENYKQQVFADDFSGPVLSGKWGRYKCSSVVTNGILVGIQEEGGGHPAVHTASIEPSSDVELNADLLFAGIRPVELAFAQKGYTNSLGGKICRAVISTTKLVLYDDRTGGYKNEIYAMKIAKTVDAATEALLKTKEAAFPVQLESGKWYAVSVRVKGDMIQAFIDGKLVGSLCSEGIAYPKNKIALVTPGNGIISCDNFAIKVP
ncbi:MAG: hypothetical protein HOO88_00815 [Kiritimatiellaceae bacterium]|nr:hypothetical protein [Kiritimatiellaceae bacterium]